MLYGLSELNSSIPGFQGFAVTFPLRTYRSAVRANSLKASPNLSDLVFYLLTERTTPRLRNAAPILVLAVLVAGRSDA